MFGECRAVGYLRYQVIGVIGAKIEVIVKKIRCKRRVATVVFPG